MRWLSIRLNANWDLPQAEPLNKHFQLFLLSTSNIHSAQHSTPWCRRQLNFILLVFFSVWIGFHTFLSRYWLLKRDRKWISFFFIPTLLSRTSSSSSLRKKVHIANNIISIIIIASSIPIFRRETMMPAKQSSLLYYDVFGMVNPRSHTHVE